VSAAKPLGIDGLKKVLNELKEHKITIGFQGQSGSALHPEANVPMAKVAKWHEYGTAEIPARPFLRTTAKQNKKEFKDANKKAISDVIDQRAKPEEVLERLGQIGADAAKKVVLNASDWAEPLSSSTVKRKGFSAPLVDTGSMVDAISWAIRKNDAIVKQGGER
jgi:hypothetical protein